MSKLTMDELVYRSALWVHIDQGRQARDSDWRRLLNLLARVRGRR